MPGASGGLSGRADVLRHLAGRAASDPRAISSDGELEEKFQEFVGTVFFGQFMKAMRRTVGKPAYFHGGQAEEIFQGQLDQTLIEELAKQQGGSFGADLFARFRQGLEGKSASAPENPDGSLHASEGPAFLARL